MYEERCKKCGAKEGEHDIWHDVMLKGLTRAETAEEIKKRFPGGDPPCDGYESEVVHLPGCPVAIDDPSTRGEIYCQDLPEGCAGLIRLQQSFE